MDGETYWADGDRFGFPGQRVKVTRIPEEGYRRRERGLSAAKRGWGVPSKPKSAKGVRFPPRRRDDGPNQRPY